MPIAKKTLKYTDTHKPHQSIQLEHLLLLHMYTVLNDCKIKLTVYTFNARLGLLGWFYDTLQLQCHAYYQYQLQLRNKHLEAARLKN